MPDTQHARYAVMNKLKNYHNTAVPQSSEIVSSLSWFPFLICKLPCNWLPCAFWTVPKILEHFLCLDQVENNSLVFQRRVNKGHDPMYYFFKGLGESMSHEMITENSRNRVVNSLNRCLIV